MYVSKVLFPIPSCVLVWLVGGPQSVAESMSVLASRRVSRSDFLPRASSISLHDTKNSRPISGYCS
jgi:hypothetical protein